jgi:hypothetical protein
LGIQAIIDPIIATVASAGSAVAGGATALAEGIGIPAALAGPLGGAAEFSLGEGALGAGTAALEGKNPLTGFESGALTGALTGGFGPLVGSITGLPLSAADALTGAGAGALSGAVTHTNPLVGALAGGASGFAAGGGLGSIGAPGAAGGGAGASAASTAAPAGVGADLSSSLGSADLTGPLASGSVSSAPALSTLPGNIGAGAAAGGDAGAALPGGSIDPGFSALPGASSGQGIDPGLSTGTGALNGGSIAPNSTPGFGATGGATAFAPSATTSPWSALTKNPAAVLSGVGLVSNLISGNQMSSEQAALTARANSLGAGGAGLESSLQSGVLPPGLQASLQAASAQAQASIRGFYAGHGMSGSSAEAEDLGSEATETAARGGQMAMQLFQEGLNETQMSDQLMSQLLGVQLQQDQDLSNSIGRLASSMATFSQPIQPTV